jgi:acyl-CoA synthetase (AMP-forming)/AMP-acid ligase II
MEAPEPQSLPYYCKNRITRKCTSGESGGQKGAERVFSKSASNSGFPANVAFERSADEKHGDGYKKNVYKQRIMCTSLAFLFISISMHILDILESHAIRYPNKPVYTYVNRDGEESEQFSYQQLNDEVLTISNGLMRRFDPGSRVILLLPTESSFIRFFLSSLRAHLIAVPCPIGFSEAGIQRILNIVADCGAVGIVTNQKTHKMLFQRQTDASKSLSDLDIDWVITDNFLNDENQASPADHAPSTPDIAYLQYTSGSTSRPKGVMITHDNLVANLSAINNCFGRTPEDTSVTWLPHYHDMGLVDGLLSPLYTGGTGVVISPLVFVSRPFLLLQMISQYRAGFCGGPGFGLDQCVMRANPELLESIDLRCLRVLYVGAEPIRVSTLEKFAEQMRAVGFRRESLVPAYGLAEATLAVSLHYNGTPLIFQKKDGDHSKEVVACGPPVEKTTVCIVDPESKVSLENGALGEIWVKNAGVAWGYWQNEEATEATFHAYTSDGQGPFLRTGDLGFMDDGKLFITGRTKELIIIRGVNYYPQDIEEVVGESHQSIQPNATAAFSMETEDGEALMIVSELKRTAEQEEGSTAIESKIAQAVGHAFGLLVHKVVLIPPGKLPKTSSGKIQRLQARKLYANNG